MGHVVRNGCGVLSWDAVLSAQDVRAKGKYGVGHNMIIVDDGEYVGKMTFSEWKDHMIKMDTEANGGVKTFRPRDWYYTAYGYYCHKWNEEQKRA